jgi:conjugal transfer ATP-binding protein TraC
MPSMPAALRSTLFGSQTSAARPGFLGFAFSGDEESPADQFASWLPYISYLDQEQLFVNRDGIGFMLEVMPQSGADDRMVEVLISLYANCPSGTGIQFHLYGSPHIRAQLRQYANLRTEDSDQLDKAGAWGRPARNDNLYRKLARRRFEHLTNGAHHSLTQGFHYTVRDFRLVMSVTIQGDPEDLGLREQIVSLPTSSTGVRCSATPIESTAATPPTSTTTTAARSATRSSITTPSRMPRPTACNSGRKAAVPGSMCASSASSPSPSASVCGRWVR